MIKIEYLNGGTLIKHYSDAGYMLLQIETGAKYSDPIDIVPCPYTYMETNEPVDQDGNEENSPENAPTLYEEIEYKEGIRIIPETITVGKAFAKDERGWWKDEVYKSLIDANVYTPDAYPAGWSKEG